MEWGNVKGPLRRADWRRPLAMTASLEERFWSRVAVVEDGGWEWAGPTNPFGYGNIGVDGQVCNAHRVSWELHYGPIPEGMWGLHHCDNPPCVRPTHLYSVGVTHLNTNFLFEGVLPQLQNHPQLRKSYLGNQSDNERDKVRRGRHHNANKAHCQKATNSLRKIRI